MLKKFINFIKKKPNYKNLDAKIWVQNIILKTMPTIIFGMDILLQGLILLTVHKIT